MLQMGVLTMGVSYMFLASLAYIEESVIYCTMALFSRLMQGFASCLIQTVCYSICTNFYPDRKQSLVSYMEVVTGIGFIIGPIVGSILYNWGGVLLAFSSFGFTFILFSFFVNMILPSAIDFKASEETVNSSMSQSKQSIIHETEVQTVRLQSNGYFTLMKNRRFTFAACCGALEYFRFCFMEPILASRIAEFNVSQA